MKIDFFANKLCLIKLDYQVGSMNQMELEQFLKRWNLFVRSINDHFQKTFLHMNG